MFSTQCNDFIFLDVPRDERERIGAHLRLRAFALMAAEQGGEPLADSSNPAVRGSQVESAIRWLLPQVNQALDSAGLPGTFSCQLRQLLHVTSSTKAVTADAACHVLRLDLQTLGNVP